MTRCEGHHCYFISDRGGVSCRYWVFKKNNKNKCTGRKTVMAVGPSRGSALPAVVVERRFATVRNPGGIAEQIVPKGTYNKNGSRPLRVTTRFRFPSGLPAGP